MLSEGRDGPFAIHASAVSIGGRGLLIAGRSGAGKSRLAFALVAASTTRLRIVLVGDDRILLNLRGGRLWASPHPRIAGFIERRGLGLVATAWRGRAPVAGLLQLGGGDDFAAPAFRNLPSVPTVSALAPVDVAAVLAWWHRAAAKRQGHETASLVAPSRAQVWNW